MNSREKNKKVAEETFEIGNIGLYETFDKEIYEATREEATIFYSNNWILNNFLRKTGSTLVCVQGDSLKVAEKYNNVCVLNFASARNPGGGWLNGADAQEENITRKSLLYFSLVNAKDFYFENGMANLMYTDAIVYSKNVTVIRNENDILCPPWKASFVTCAAPNLTGFQGKKLPEEVFYNRMKKVLQVAALNGHEEFVLGAWGTGVFGWPTEVVAKLFVKAIQETSCIKTAVFAIPDKEKKEIFIEAILNKQVI